jgi:sortase B
MKRAAHSAKKPGKAKRRALLVIEIVCIIIAVVCGVFLIQDLSRYWIADNEFKEITQEYNRDVDRLVTDNPDCVGWIKVEDTRIDYPVMYTPNDPEYYLHRNFEGDYSSSGTPFLGEGSIPTGNSLIAYGHHMNDGSMFAELEKFDDAEFGLGHTIEYKTSTGVASYKPIACWYEDLTVADCYHYWEQVGNLDAKRFNDYVANAKARSLYGTGASATYGDKLITLSTCSYGTAEQRFVVVAVLER